MMIRVQHLFPFLALSPVVSLPLTVLNAPGACTFSAYDVIVLAVLSILLLHALVYRTPGALNTGYDIPLSLFIGAAVLSALLSPDRIASFGSVMHFCLYVGLFFFYQRVPMKRGEAERLAMVLLSSGAVVSVYGVYDFMAHLLSRSSPDLVRAFSFFPSPNIMGSVLLLLVCAAFMAPARTHLEKSLKGGLCAFMLMALALTLSRSSIIALIIVSYVYAFFISRERLLWLKISGIFAFISLALSCSLPDAVYERLQNLVTFNWDFHALMRIDVWKSALSMWLTSPLLGVGPSMFGRLYPVFALPGPGCYYLYLSHAHNIILHMLAEYGIMGALAFFAFLTMALRRCCQTYLSRSANGQCSPLEQGLFLGLCALLIQNLLDYTLWYPAVAYPFFLVLGWTAREPGNPSRDDSPLEDKGPGLQNIDMKSSGGTQDGAGETI